MELFERLEWWLNGPILIVTAILGLLGNLVFIAVFTCKWRNLNTFHRFRIASTKNNSDIRAYTNSF